MVNLEGTKVTFQWKGAEGPLSITSAHKNIQIITDFKDKLLWASDYLPPVPLNQAKLFSQGQDWKGHYTCIHRNRNPDLTIQTYISVLSLQGGGVCCGSKQRLHFERHEL